MFGYPCTGDKPYDIHMDLECASHMEYNQKVRSILNEFLTLNPEYWENGITINNGHKRHE